MTEDSSLAAKAAAGIRRREFLALAGLAVMAGPALAQADAGGDVLTISQPEEPQPQSILATRAGNWTWYRNVFEPLTGINPKTFEPEPLLAKSWKLADDKMSMDITLRDDVTFHTGRKMTADDVKYSFEEAVKPESVDQTGFIAKDFASIDVTGDHSLTIKFKRPISNIFDFFEQAVILDKETYAQHADGSKVIGTGPYMWETWTPGTSVTLKKYPGYRDAAKVKIGELDFVVITDSTAGIAALRSGRTAVGTSLSATDTVQFDRNPQYSIRQAGGTIYPFGVNVTMAPFDKKEVRQALGYAIDRKRINEQVFNSTGTTTDLFWSPSAPGYTDALANRYTYDPGKAKKMIADAGAAGTKVTITLDALPTMRSIYEIVANNLREVGLDCEAQILDGTEYNKRQVAGDLGAAFLLLHGQIGFSSTTFLSSLPSLRKGNPSHFWSDDYAKLRDAMSAAGSQDELAKATEALSAYLLDEAFNLALVQAPDLTVVSTQLQGLNITAHNGLLFADATMSS